MNYREISDKLNKSPSRIGQIFKNGMKKLRHPSRIDLLPDLSKSAFNKRQARLEQREIELLLFYQEIITALKNEGVQNLAENHFIFQMASFKFSIPINELKMSIRSYNYLHNARIETVGELVKKTEVEMLKILNFGRKSLAEVKLILAEMNLSFGMKF
ncbi:hypothetical protein KAI92_00390 [Candidatus Parcubacteria bacterium]|nr:hypothetical protein [Candidatus Parcubacteria bacterium]